MRRPRTRWLVTAAIAAVTIVATLSIIKHRKFTLPEGFASTNGRLEATETDIATKRPGRLDKVLVSEGEAVRRDEIVARMDVRDLEADLREAKAGFDEAVQETSAAEARVAQQESAVDFAAAEFKRSESLVKKKLQSQEQADLARSRLKSEQAGLKVALASVTQAEASVEAARAKIESIQTELDDSILKAPIEGRILYRLAEPGEVLAEGGKILTLIDLTDVYMTAFFSTEQAGQLKVGSEARIVLDATPETVIPAHISFISPEAQFTPKEVETKSEREKLMFRIKAQIDRDWLTTHRDSVTSGLPGTLYVRLLSNAAWPETLRLPAATRKETWPMPSSQED